MKFIRDKFSLGLLVISISLFLYTIYKSQFFIEENVNIFLFKKYFIISILLFIFAIITFFIKNEIKEYLIIISISIIFSIYSLETYLLYKDYSKKNKLKDIKKLSKRVYENSSGKKYEIRNIKKFYLDKKKKDTQIKLSIAPITHINKNNFFPFSGISKSKTIHCNENGYYSMYESDRFGFNNNDKVWDKNSIEYLLIGDSFTHGACVNREGNISSNLELLSKSTVLNLGFSGNGPLIEFATLREYLMPNVNKILWIYYENDLENLSIELKNPILQKYIQSANFSQNLKNRQNEIDNYLDEYAIKNFSDKEHNKKNTFSYLIRFIELQNLRNYLFSQQQLPIEKFKKIAQLTKDLSLKNKSELYFIYLPSYSQLRTSIQSENFLIIKDIINELDIEFINVHNELIKEENEPIHFFSLKGFGHYNLEGYKTVANIIFKLIGD